MTIAISLKVNDGLVLASDSATTIVVQGRHPADAGGIAVNVYDYACKITNLRKGFPIGCITWGAGSIGNASISTITRDFREAHKPEADYTVEQVAQSFSDYVSELWSKAYRGWPDDSHPRLSFIVAGYSSRSRSAQEFGLSFDAKGGAAPQQLRGESECGVTWNGEPEALSRLLVGFDPRIAKIMVDKMGISQTDAETATKILRQELAVPVINPAMPIQDAIDLARFMVELTIKWKRFTPGAPTVGGPVEIATITKHEGFKWIARKHYYSRDLNPDDQRPEG